MGLLEQTERAGGRWIVAPRKGEAFVGRRERARARARARRRRVLMVLLETLALTLLIGMFPPLHGMWILDVKRHEASRPLPARGETTGLDVPLGPAAPSKERPLGWLAETDIVHVRVHDAAELEVAGV